MKAYSLVSRLLRTVLLPLILAACGAASAPAEDRGESDDFGEGVREDGVATVQFAASSLPNLVIDQRSSYVSMSGAARCTYRNIGGSTYDGTLTMHLILYDASTGEMVVRKQTALSTRTRPPWTSAWVGFNAIPALRDNPEQYDVMCWVEAGTGANATESSPIDNSEIIMTGIPECWGDSLAEDVDCWLLENTNVASDVRWTEIGGTVKSWSDWHPIRRSQLRAQVYEYVSYLARYPGGADPRDYAPNDILPVSPTPTPIQNRFGHQDNIYSVISENDGWLLYMKSVAMSLANEMRGSFSWGISGGSSGRRAVLDGSQMFTPLNNSAQYSDLPPITGFALSGAIPMSGLHAREFLVANDLIGNDVWDTLERVLTWSRRLNHAVTQAVDDHELLFGVRGVPPAYLMALGTESAFPGQNPGSFRHFTQGCTGTMAFLQSVLRAVNIPVERAYAYGHAAPVFVMPGGRYHLTHADLLYDADWFQLEPAPTTGLLIPARYQRGYFAADSSSVYVRRSEGYLYADYFGGGMIRSYCDDVAAGRTTPAQRANGLVAGKMARWYSAAELESWGFWERLEAMVTAHGGCSAARSSVANRIAACSAADFTQCIHY
jgi:hypothetical protein